MFPEDVEDAAWLPYPPRGAPAPVVPRCGELPADAPVPDVAATGVVAGIAVAGRSATYGVALNSGRVSCCCPPNWGMEHAPRTTAVTNRAPPRVRMRLE